MSAASSDASHGLALSFNPADRIKKFAAPTVWHEFTPLAQQVKAVNLGQGFPGWEAPKLMKDANIKATLDNHNQYARSQGHIPLVQEVAKRYSEKVFEGKRTIDPLTEVAITTGASEALFAIEHGIINPGDEVVTFEPAFDLYIAQTDMAGGILKTVPIRCNPHSAASDKLAANSEWFVDWEEFEKAFTAKTRMVIINTPHNPTGKVFTREELTKIASIVKKFPNVVVVADEVYENMTYDGRPHVSIATLDGMWDRSVTISSAGKTFSVTGWKVGWVVGPAHLVRCVGITHQWVSFSTANPVQDAVATALKTADAPYESFPSYYDWLHDFYTRKRSVLVEGLKAAGLKPIVPEGSFFVMADTSDVIVPDEYLNDKSVTRDWALARFFTKEIGVCCIPPSAFYGNDTKHLAENLVRFAFCQPDDRLNEACNRLLKVRAHLRK